MSAGIQLFFLLARSDLCHLYILIFCMFCGDLNQCLLHEKILKASTCHDIWSKILYNSWHQLDISCSVMFSYELSFLNLNRCCWFFLWSHLGYRESHFPVPSSSPWCLSPALVLEWEHAACCCFHGLHFDFVSWVAVCGMFFFILFFSWYDFLFVFGLFWYRYLP